MKGFLKKEAVLRKKKKVRIELSVLQKQLIVGAGLMLVVALVLYGVWYITRIPSLQVQEVLVIGGETIPHDLIKEKVDTALLGTYFGLIPKRFLALYPQDAVIQSVKTVDRVKNVYIERGTEGALTVVFDEHIPYALWCAQETEETCLFIDRTGFAFAEAPSLEGSAFVRYVEDAVAPEVGKSGFESSFVRDTELFSDLLRDNLSLYVTHIQKLGVYDVEYTISGGGTIKVSQSIPMQKSFENLQTILQSPEFAHITPGSFSYIDLRFGEKIFVNEVQGNGATSTQSTTTDSL